MPSTLKKIAKLTVISIFMLLPFMAMAQKLEKPSIDAIYGDTSFTTTQKRVASTADILAIAGSVLGADARRTSNHVYLDLEVDVLGDDGYFFVPDGSRVIVKLANNTRIYLTSIGNERAENRSVDLVSSSRQYWTANLSYSISALNMAKILASDIVVIRVEAKDQTFDFDIKTKNSKVIQKMLKLVRQPRPPLNLPR